MNSRISMTYIFLTTALAISVGHAAESDWKEKVPVEKRWTETIGGKVVNFMTIDGIMVHEKDPKKQPLPTIITPGTVSTPKKVGTAPSDAIVLFDGTKESNPSRSLDPASCT
jgi:hypothetical protein